MIPKYLKDISELIKKSDLITNLHIKCICGHSFFRVYRSKPLDEVSKLNYGEIIRENQHLYFVKRNFWGKIVSKIDCKEIQSKKPRNLVRVKCLTCGEQYTIFDNYKNGYDAIVNASDYEIEKGVDTSALIPVFPQKMEVFISIYQDVSYNDFLEEHNNLNAEKYLEAFSNIDIYGVDSGKKKVKIYSEETA